MTRVQATGLSSTTVGWSRLGASVSFELPLCFNRPLACSSSPHQPALWDQPALSWSPQPLFSSALTHVALHSLSSCALCKCWKWMLENVHLAACIHFAALSLVSSPVALSSACQKIHCIAFSTELHCILLSTELHCFALLNSCWFVYQPLLLPPLHWDQHSLTSRTPRDVGTNTPTYDERCICLFAAWIAWSCIDERCSYFEQLLCHCEWKLKLWISNHTEKSWQNIMCILQSWTLQ